jgi:hypothetical protein
MRVFLNRLLKFVLLCLAIYTLLVGASLVINTLNRLMDKESSIALHNMRILKYPLFVLVGYLVFSERI